MSKILENLFYSKMGQSLLSALGVKPAQPLQRFQGQLPWISGKTMVANEPSAALKQCLSEASIDWIKDDAPEADTYQAQPVNAMLFDATELNQFDDLKALKRFFANASKVLQKSGKIAILGRTPSTIESVEGSSVAEALSGFTRSLGKELGKKGITVNLLYVSGVIDSAVTTPLNFFLSNRSSYISGQPLTISSGQATSVWTKPLDGKIALVTGAAQGIGAAIAQVLARDGAKVIGLDIPPAKEALTATMNAIGGEALACDITSETAANDIAHCLSGRKLDILVHNAGVTRDKTLGKMPEHFWDMAININLSAPANVTRALETQDQLSQDVRVICISSISGLAGNVGQTNYSASKSGIAGYVRKQAAVWQGTGKTINAIAPGFIETQMTDQIPFMTREVGRRMNSLSQGGQPQDVAEGVALFAQPGSSCLNGQILRVCGQSLIGA